MRNGLTLRQERVEHDHEKARRTAIKSKKNKRDTFQVQVL